MDSDSFASITRSIIEREGENGLEGFVPVACYPERRVILALSDVPASVDLETVVLAWARRESANPGEECLVAFRHDDASFKVVRIEGHSEEHHVYAA